MQKSLLCLFLVTVYTASAVPLTAEYSKVRVYPRFMEFLDSEGVIHTVAEPALEQLSEIETNADNNQYLLFTRRNQIISQPLKIKNTNSVTNSNFNAHVPTVVIAHGWLGNQYADINPTIRNAYLGKSDVNVIILDWGKLAMSDYATATRGVPDVGRGLGQFLAFLNRVTGQAFTEMHLVGFSLGAHLVGIAGRELGGKVARITALDPAGPLWNYNTNRVRPGDGVYVEAIHTNGGDIFSSAGISFNVANVDFYPNGGVSQPGCLTNLCNHNRAWELFAATVKYNHLVGSLCANNTQLRMNNCHGAQLPMGNDDLRKTGSGMYRLDTSSKYPY